MQTTNDFLNAVKARAGVASDYALAPVLGLTRGAVSNYRNKRSFLDDSTAIAVGKLLEIDPAYVVACAHAERAREEGEKSFWQGLADRLAPERLCIMLSGRHGKKRRNAPLFENFKISAFA